MLFFNQNKISIPQAKKKKKDKKKHKHKHKHKHSKDKVKDKKDPAVARLQTKDETPETLSSADSSSNSNPAILDLTV